MILHGKARQIKDYQRKDCLNMVDIYIYIQSLKIKWFERYQYVS
jgi:hypothetical protein